MGKTSIEWTDRSVNPIRARLGENTGHYCEKISAGCKNCYSSRTQPRFRMPVFQDQRRAGVESFFDPKRLAEVLRRKKPTKWFWCDMTDMFGSWVPNEWIAACFGVMAATPHHTHQVLTKRAARLPEWFAWLDEMAQASAALFPADDLNWRRIHILRASAMRAGVQMPSYGAMIHSGWPLPNVHLGVSCEDQATADQRIPALLETPAAVRWVSAEPLLGPLDLSAFMPSTTGGGWTSRLNERDELELIARCIMNYIGLDWLVVGSESGPGARPMDVAWARSIVDQCRTAGVPVFTKQIATPLGKANGEPKGGDPRWWPTGTWPREFPR